MGNEMMVLHAFVPYDDSVIIVETCEPEITKSTGYRCGNAPEFYKPIMYCQSAAYLVLVWSHMPPSYFLVIFCTPVRDSCVCILQYDIGWKYSEMIATVFFRKQKVNPKSNTKKDSF
jgi:hypothetical protein